MASGDSGGWGMLHFKHLSVRATQYACSQLRELGVVGERNNKKLRQILSCMFCFKQQLFSYKDSKEDFTNVHQM